MSGAIPPNSHRAQAIALSFYQKTKDLAKEAILIGLAIKALKMVSDALCRQLPHISSITPEEIWVPILFGSITEELLFRGAIQNTIGWIQKKWTSKVKLSEEDLKSQQVFRVHLTAILFGLYHLTNNPLSIIQASLVYLPGTSYSYLKEKYNTLSITILAHGIHNAIVGCALVSLERLSQKSIYLILASQSACLIVVIVNEIFWYRLSRGLIELPSLEQAKDSSIKILRNLKDRMSIPNPFLLGQV